MLDNPVFSQHFNRMIQTSKRCKRDLSFYVGFPLGKYQFKTEETLSDFQTIMLAPLFLFKCFSSWNNEEKHIRHYVLTLPLISVIVSI